MISKCSSKPEGVIRFYGQSKFVVRRTYFTTLLFWSIFMLSNLFPARISASKGGLTLTATLILSFLFPPFKLLISFILGS